MKEYICIRCGKNFKNNKSCIRKHFNRKNICKSKHYDIEYSELLNLLNNNEYINYYNNVIKNTISNYNCEHCDKLFCNKYNLNRHIKICKVKHKSETSTTPQKQVIHKNVYNIINNNYINNIVNIENINAFGKENVSFIDYKKLKFLDKGDYEKITLKDKSFNHIHNLKSILDDIYTNPENHNFKLLNKREQKYKIKIDEENYEVKHINELHNDINNILVNIYDEFLDDNKEQLQHYIDHLKLHYIQLQKYKLNNRDKTAKEYNIINNKIQKCLKRAIQWIGEEIKNCDN